MYHDDTIPFEMHKRCHSRCAPAIERFESWLRSHGYQPGRDPFFPAETYADDAVDVADLVTEYLDERPTEQRNRQALLEHAEDVGTPDWVSNGCGLPLIFREIHDSATTADRPFDPARDIFAFAG